MRKTVSGGQVPLEGKGASDDENEYNLFLWEMRFRIVLHITIFSKIVSCPEKMMKKKFPGGEEGTTFTLAFFMQKLSIISLKLSMDLPKLSIIFDCRPTLDNHYVLSF